MLVRLAGIEPTAPWFVARYEPVSRCPTDNAEYPFLDIDPNAGETPSNGGLNTFCGFSVEPRAGDITPFMDLLTGSFLRMPDRT
jgi:hypothetical protein